MIDQYKILVYKEFKLLINNKKILLLSLFAAVYAPICNLLSTNSLISLSYGVPLLIIIGTLFPSELTYSISKSEYAYEVNDILKICPCKPSIIIASKVTIPILLSIINLVFSVSLNEVLSQYYHHMYHDFITLPLIFLIILMMLWSTLLYIYISQIFEKVFNKNFFTSILFIQMACCTLFYSMYYYKINVLPFGILLFLSVLMIILCLDSFNNRRFLKSMITQTKFQFENLNTISILIKDGYCHCFNKRKTIVFLLFSFISIISISLYSEMKMFYIYLYAFLCLSLCNFIIYPSTINAKKSSVLLHLKLSNLNFYYFTFSRLVFPFVINLIISFMFAMFLNQSIFLMNSLNLSACLFIYYISLRISNYTYEKQYIIYLTILELLICVIIINVTWFSLFIIIILFALLYNFNKLNIESK